MIIWMSKHALEQARERGMTIAEIESTIQCGAKYLQDENKIVSDYRYTRVVYRKIKEKYFIITVMLRK